MIELFYYAFDVSMTNRKNGGFSNKMDKNIHYNFSNVFD